ncbi:MAG: hypothetical protein ACI4VQ_06050 [Clostridia bacterium]
MIKKEFGKPKSVTKRTLREYQEEDIDSCVKVVEEAPKKVEDSPETIELNRKIEILDSKYIGIYKVTFVKNDILSHNVQYIYASDIDDAYAQIRFIANKDDMDADLVISKIKSVIRMTGNAIKVDKACLKRIGEDSVEDLEKMLTLCIKDEKETYENAISKFKQLYEKGFNLYIGKMLCKGKVHFAEMARSDEEANGIIIAEERTQKMILSGIKVEGTNIGLVEEINKKSDKYTDVDPIKDANVYVDAIKGLAQKNDLIYQLLFGKQTVEEYIKFVDHTVDVIKKIKEGKGKEMLMQKLDEVTEALTEKDRNLQSILSNKRNPFSNDERFLRTLFKK